MEKVPSATPTDTVRCAALASFVPILLVFGRTTACPLDYVGVRFY